MIGVTSCIQFGGNSLGRTGLTLKVGQFTAEELADAPERLRQAGRLT
jgi:hypothetical protein